MKGRSSSFSQDSSELCARYGQWSAEATSAYDPDGSADLSTLISRANDDFGQAEPARFAADACAANGSPVHLYRFSYVQTSMREQMRGGTPHGGETAYVFGTLSAGRDGAPTPEDFAVSRMAQSYWVNFAKTGDPNGAGHQDGHAEGNRGRQEGRLLRDRRSAV